MTIREMIKELEKLAELHGENLKVGHFDENGLKMYEAEDICFYDKGSIFGEVKEDMIII